jgi:hypothetical protein
VSKPKRPKRLFRQRRGECQESARFRLEMHRADDADRDERWRKLGVNPDSANFEELARLADFDGIFPMLQLPGKPLVLAIHPKQEYEDHADFDRAVVSAGLPRFARPMMRSDIPPGDLPEDLVADLQRAQFIIVTGLATGIRSRCLCCLKREEADS